MTDHGEILNIQAFTDEDGPGVWTNTPGATLVELAIYNDLHDPPFLSVKMNPKMLPDSSPIHVRRGYVIVTFYGSPLGGVQP